MANSQRGTASQSNLYKAFFNDETLSDLTVRMSDKTKVFVHRIVLCRRSEYFTKLLTGAFQERGAKEIELKEDDPDALYKLLLYIYDLPWDDRYSDESFLVAHAKIYVVADKYQVHGLKVAVSEEMNRVLDPGMDIFNDHLEDEIEDFLDSLTVIVTGTAANDVLARKVMVEACVRNLRYLYQNPKLKSLLMDSAELGAAIVSHQSLGFSLAGAWVCGEDVTHNASIDCRFCDAHFEEEFAWQTRYEEEWTCSKCGHKGSPRCFHCGVAVRWVDRELLPERV